MPEKECEILIIGAGIIGLTIAKELIKEKADKIIIIEKEREAGIHASGRNSGVLHSGIYYTPDSLKAKFCIEGNKLMSEFCEKHKLSYKRTGKVIVAKNPNEIPILYELKRRAELSGAEVYIIDEKELSKIEPYAKTYEKALYSPNTAVIEPKEIIKALESELLSSKNITISYEETFLRLKNDRTAITSKNLITFKKLINAAGCYADKIAHSFDLAKEYKILPFKGTYKKLKEDASHKVNGNIYPVPDIKNPFLGIHFTKNTQGTVYVGPTAIPAFGRENYSIFDDISYESLKIIYRDALLFLKSKSFRLMALKESKKYFSNSFFKEAKELVPALKKEELINSDKIGIRAQLINWKEKKLVMDYVVIKGDNSLHILNAISPAFTSSMAFAKELAYLF